MLVKEIVGSKSELDLSEFQIDELSLEWYELGKRIQRKESKMGREIALKFMGENKTLKDGDVLHIDHEAKIATVVQLIECEVIVLSPSSMLEMATVCYEIGNKHMPLFIDGEQILLPYEAPMFAWLDSEGYKPTMETRSLNNRLKSKAADHHQTSEHSSIGETLFNKVINFAAKKSQ